MKAKKTVQFLSPYRSPCKQNGATKNVEKDDSKQKKLVQKKKTIKPFGENFFSKVVDLEEQVIMSNYDFGIVNELILLYAKCVEYYDSKKDPISKYFQDKMQSTLTNQKTLKMVFHNQDKSHQLKTESLNNSSKDSFSKLDTSDSTEDDEDNNSTCQSYNESPLNPNKLNHKSIGLVKSVAKNSEDSKPVNFTIKRNSRQKKIQFFVKIQKENQQNADSIIKQYNDSDQLKQTLLMEDIKGQENKIQDRIRNLN